MNKKYNYLSKNFILFTISSFGPKIVVFVMLPLYTNYLSTADYGIGDIITTTVSLLLPIFSLCIESAILRFCFDKNFLPEQIFSNGISIFIRGVALCFLGVALLCAIPKCNIDKIYLWTFFLLYVANGLYNILTNYLRGIEQVNVIVEMSLIATIASCLLNIFLLVFLDMGLNGFLLASYLGIFIAVFWGSIRAAIWKVFQRKYINIKIQSELKHYSIPLIFNKIGWWINGAADRYIVTWLLGVTSNGVYTVAYKIPTILTACSDIFSQAWQLSAIKDIDEYDSDGFVLKMYNLYNAFLVIICSILMILSIPMAKVLYAKDFFEAWRFVPPLMISIIFGGLSGFFGSIFIAVKDTKIFTVSTLIGGLVNIVLNILLIYIMGTAMGAAVATLLSNVVIWMVRYYWSRRYVKMRLPIMYHMLMYLLLVIQFMICLGGFKAIFIGAQCVILILLMGLNRRELFIVLNQGIEMLKRVVKK